MIFAPVHPIRRTLKRIAEKHGQSYESVVKSWRLYCDIFENASLDGFDAWMEDMHNPDFEAERWDGLS